MKLYDIIVRGIGILGILAVVLAFQCRKHSHILIFRAANEFLFAVQYLLFGIAGRPEAYTGKAMNFVGSVRNVIFTEQVKRGKSTRLSAALFSALLLFLTIVTWQGPKSILVGSAKVASTLAYGNPNPKVVRLVSLLTSSCWLIYDIALSAFEGMICDVLALGSIIVGIVRYDLLKKPDSHLPQR